MTTSLKKALLIHFPDRYVEEEAFALATAGGYEPAAQLTQRYLDRARYGIGEGKAEEAAALVREQEIGTLLFDGRLNASQTYNLAKLCKVEVKDREKLILEIFAKRATTAEAKLQVELAELRYELPRARDKVRKAKSGEQPGFFGLGKYEVDVYVRMMKRQMATLKRKVGEVKGRRDLLIERRAKTGKPTVALTGYTGAGKRAESVALGHGRFHQSAAAFSHRSLQVDPRRGGLRNRSAPPHRREPAIGKDGDQLPELRQDAGRARCSRD